MDEESCVKEVFKKALETLTPREKKVICLLFGIECQQHSIEQVAKVIENEEHDMDFLMEHVSQIK